MSLFIFIGISISLLIIGILGFIFSGLFIVFIILFLIPKTKNLGKKCLEISGIIISFFFFKGIVIIILPPISLWHYIKAFKLIAKGEINPSNTFMENFNVLTEDFRYYKKYINNYSESMNIYNEDKGFYKY